MLRREIKGFADVRSPSRLDGIGTVRLIVRSNARTVSVFAVVEVVGASGF
jgi:hypothetical protein